MYLYHSNIVSQSIVAAEEKGQVRARRWRIAEKNGTDDTLMSLPVLCSSSEHISSTLDQLLTCTIYICY